METSKISNNEIGVTKTETTVKGNTYTFEFLTAQKINIQTQKDRDNLQRDTELAEIDTLLSECARLGITSKPK